MTAIITERLRRKLSQNIYNDIDSSANEYYIAIGKSEQWQTGSDTVRTPEVTEREERLFRYSVQAVGKVGTDFKFTVPKYTWTTNTVYSGYNDNIAAHPTTSYYVITSDKNVYVCLKQGKNVNGEAVVSDQKPVHTGKTPVTMSDGYTWRYLYTLSNADFTNFVTSAYMPVNDADSASDSGQILGYRILNSGSGYSSTPTINIIGNEDSAAAATPVLFNTQIVDVLPVAYGKGYDYANISVTGGGGSGAEIVPIFGPKAGLGVDTKNDLRVSAVMTSVDFTGNGSGDLVVDNDYRQIGIYKNIQPYGYIADSNFTDTLGRALRYMTVNSVTNFAIDDTLSKTEAGGTAQAYIDYIDVSNLRIWYHQNEDTGFINFTTGAGLTSTSGGSATIASFTDPEVDIHTGEVLYIDNRAAIDRTIESNDDIKIIFQI